MACWDLTALFRLSAIWILCDHVADCVVNERHLAALLFFCR